MHICEHNLTFAVYAVEFNKYLFSENNEVQGPLGQPIQKIINARKRHPFLCKLINEPKIGDKLANSSYDGALGLIQKKIVDGLFKPDHAFIDGDLVGFTQPVASESYHISHALGEKDTKSNERMVFVKFFDIPFLFCVFSSMIAFFLLSLILMVISSKMGTRSNTRDSFRNKLVRKIRFVFMRLFLETIIPRVCLISVLVGIGFIFFLFFVKHIFLINIKTNKVVVDTSQVITSQESLFSSYRKAVWIEGERDLHIAETSPRGTPLHRLHCTKNFDPPMILKKDPNVDELIFRKGFLFMSGLISTITLNFLSQYFKSDIFTNPTAFYPTYSVIYRTKDDGAKIRIIDKSVSQLVEAGLFEKMIDEIKSAKLLPESTKNKIYRNLNDYIEDHTLFEPIELNNLHYLFVIYFSLAVFLFIIFIIHHLIKFMITNLFYRTID